MNNMKVDFAPLEIPLQRRLQTAAVAQWVFSFIGLAPLCIFIFFYLLFTRFWLISVLYAVWWSYDYDTPARGGQRMHLLCGLKMWDYMRDYFPIKVRERGHHDLSLCQCILSLISTYMAPREQGPQYKQSHNNSSLIQIYSNLFETADLDPRHNYVLGFHPHGVLVAGAFTNFCTTPRAFRELFPGLTSYLLMLPLWFRSPFFRNYIMCLIPSDKESASYPLRKPGGGNAVVIAVGGAPEALNAHPGTYNVLLAQKKGFIKMAMAHGAHLWKTKEEPGFDGHRSGCKESWVSPCLSSMHVAIFQYSFGLMPYRRPIHTVVGRPIQVQRNEKPAAEELDALHQLYMDELSKLFEEHKEKYGVDKDTQLNFV
ncbi:hypothetical protein KUCAC02_003813 [Chaenocephalus aceratus]|uniref:Uncharacterized protein n=1 Tax=Chaenocephalus aceratus TaxID=36190 RepID=A0ACB9WLR0_CHAAC|nr:hypothetical protein KUCAC02_003813 [Chaenocephalus aceratus]